MCLCEINHNDDEAFLDLFQDLNQLRHPREERRSSRWGGDHEIPLLSSMGHIGESLERWILTSHLGVDLLPCRIKVRPKELVIGSQEKYLVPVLLW